MNIHTRLIGALDAVILGLTALVMIALVLALIDPIYDSGRVAAHVLNMLPASGYAVGAA